MTLRQHMTKHMTCVPSFVMPLMSPHYSSPSCMQYMASRGHRVIACARVVSALLTTNCRGHLVRALVDIQVRVDGQTYCVECRLSTIPDRRQGKQCRTDAHEGQLTVGSGRQRFALWMVWRLRCFDHVAPHMNRCLTLSLPVDQRSAQE